MVNFIVKGIVIGMLVSAPLGPSGVLCIQQTLSRGRMHGFMTGLGVAFSDLIYALITGLGMSFATSFIESNQLILQIIGSFVMFGFGIYLFRRNPIISLRNSSEQKSNYAQQFITGFLLTFSNAFIIFLFIGLYARFGYFTDDFHFPMRVFAYLLILAGAILWWFSITYLVAKVKKKYNIRNIWVLNKSIGVIIIFISIVGILYAVGIINDSISIDKLYNIQ